MYIQLYMTSSLGTIYHPDLNYRVCVVLVQGKTLPDDLVRLEIQGCDAIVETEWIAKRKVTCIMKGIREKHPP